MGVQVVINLDIKEIDILMVFMEDYIMLVLHRQGQTLAPGGRGNGA